MVRTLCAALAVSLPAFAWAQHYCWPCASTHGVIGKDTHAASEAPKCYDWYLRYLNNVAAGSTNTGDGTHEFDHPLAGKVKEAWDLPPNVMAMESNECGTLAGDAKVGLLNGTTPEQMALVEQGLRLPTGEMHQCPCALAGRAHIMNGTMEDVFDWDAVTEAWGDEYVEQAKAAAEKMHDQASFAFSPEEQAHFSMGDIFGVHTVYCPFHASGPCPLADVERGVAAAWAGNFSRGYVPLMDTNAMYWVESLGPLLDAFLRDGVPFYPMVWPAPTPAEPAREVFSVLASPCGKTLVEVAAANVGGRPREQFHERPLPRAVFQEWNKPVDFASQPLMPLRLSRAIGADRLDAVLDFYGAGPRKTLAAKLGFHSRILADVTGADGARAVTLMLSPLARVHLQLWARPEAEPAGPAMPSSAAFTEAAGSNQVNGGFPASATAFCSRGTWTVKRYTEYLLAVHDSVMSPPQEIYDPLYPAVGDIMDVFLDDHIAWDCTAPECDMAAGGEALREFGSRVQWVNTGDLGPGWTPYSHDPAGYGVQLHWFHAPADFAPQGPVYPECFSAWTENSTCARAFVSVPQVV